MRLGDADDGGFFFGGRLFWSKMVTLLSFVINILMLATWNARASLHDTVIPKNATKVPRTIYE